MRYRELFEYNVQDLKNRYMGKIRERLEEENSKYTKMSDEELLQIMDEADPTPTNKYVTWIALRYAKGNINRFEDIPSRIRPALKEYWQMFNKKLLKDEHRNLGKIKDIEDVLDSYKADDTEIPLLFPKDGDKGDYDILHNTNEFLVIHLRDKTSACYFGHNTRWCTAKTDDKENKFHWYSKDLIIIVDKKNNRKYQIHHERNQYMDEKDKPLSDEFMISLSKRDQYFVKLFKYEKLDNGYSLNNKKIEQIGDLTKTTMYYSGTNTIYEVTWRNSSEQLHNPNGPAYVICFKNGQIMQELYYINGRRHRENGPAYIVYYIHGQIEWEKYYINGHKHREDGPAAIIYYRNGNIQTITFWLNDLIYTFDDWAKKLNLSPEEKNKIAKEYVVEIS